MWKDEYLSNLNIVIDFISKGDIDNAKIKLADYLIELRNIGGYEKNIWRVNWRLRLYEFGKLFTDDASWIFPLIEEEIRIRGSYEALDFLHSEIMWNFFDNKNDCVKDEIKSFIKKYKSNPEFHHSYSHILEYNKNYELAVSESKHALSQEKDNYIFLYTYTDKVKKYFDHLINNGKLDEATNLLEIEEKYYQLISPNQKDFIVKLNNTAAFSMLRDRLKDHITISKRVEYFSQEIDKKINFEQKKLIEVLGLFSAILGFILTNISIGISNLHLRDMMTLMISMAVTLIIFAITISYLFGRGNRSIKFWEFLKDRKFWAVILLCLILLLIFLKT